MDSRDFEGKDLWELKDERVLMGLPRSTQERAQAHFSASAGQGKAHNQHNETRKVKPNSELECWNCKKKGHKANECGSAPSGEFGPAKRSFDSSANSGDNNKRGGGGGGGGGGAK